ncbi:sensor histidine kinase [Paenibacillus methanolicus]|nr:sensor histidine kinase [Paenibacillus methanolicus]
MSRGWHALWTLAVALIFPFILTGEPVNMETEELIDSVANLAILFGIGFIFQKLVGSYQRINAMYRVIQDQNRTLELYAKQIEQLTLAEERNRLSRDLHDTVGHTFTTAITGMDAVYYLIDLSPVEAKKSMRELLHFTRNGLDEVRRHIHQLAPHDEGQSLSRILNQIASEFALHTGTKVDLETTGIESPLPEQARLALIRCLQESLTNAKRHGNANRIDISLSYGQGEVRLRVEDDGQGANGINEGFGLRTMAERMANAGGSVIWIAEVGKGMTLECTVPTKRDPGLLSNQEGA